MKGIFKSVTTRTKFPCPECKGAKRISRTMYHQFGQSNLPRRQTTAMLTSTCGTCRGNGYVTGHNGIKLGTT